MKKITLIVLLCSFNLIAQVKKPILILLPSDNWCFQRFFSQEFDNDGVKIKIPNYKQAFEEDTELNQVVNRIGEYFIAQGFDLTDAAQEIKSINIKETEDALTRSSKSGSEIKVNPLEKLKNTLRPDILIQVWWKVNKSQNVNQISLTLEAFDSYTNKRIASVTSNGPIGQSEFIPESIFKMINNNIGQFTNQLQGFFNDSFKNGREIQLEMKVWKNWNKNFEAEYDGEDLTFHINQWMQKHTLNSKFNLSSISENALKFQQVRIPMFDQNNMGMDSYTFSKALQKYFKQQPFNIDIKILSRGLGESVLIFGEK